MFGVLPAKLFRSGESLNARCEEASDEKVIVNSVRHLFIELINLRFRISEKSLGIDE